MRRDRTPRGGVARLHPSKKRHRIIKAESHNVGVAFLLEVEHHDEVVESWDQPLAAGTVVGAATGQRTARLFVIHIRNENVPRCEALQPRQQTQRC